MASQVDSTQTLPKTAEVEQPTEDCSGVKSTFVERMSGIPMFDAAIKYGASAYQQVKDYNSISSFALTKAEETAVFLACTAVPYVKKIEPQVKAVDDFACRGLDIVQERLPILSRPPGEILEETRKLCATTVQTGYQTVEDVKAFGTEAVSRVKNYGVQKANEALNGTTNLVDKYLPPTGVEEPREFPAVENLSVAERAGHLTAKVGNRVYNHGVVQVQKLHTQGQEAVEKLAYTIDLVKHIRDSYSPEKVLKNYVDDAKVKATWIWEELSKEEPLETAEAEAEKSVERRLISLARRLTTQLVHTYNVATSASAAVIPQAYGENIATARAYAIELFTQLDKAIEKNEVTSSMLNVVREKVEVLDKLARSIVSSTPKPQEMIEMSQVSKETQSSNAGQISG